MYLAKTDNLVLLILYECLKNMEKRILQRQIRRSTYNSVVIVVLHIYSPVTEQRHMLTIGRSAHFSLHLLLHGWRNLHLLWSFQ